MPINIDGRTLLSNTEKEDEKREKELIVTEAWAIFDLPPGKDLLSALESAEYHRLAEVVNKPRNTFFRRLFGLPPYDAGGSVICSDCKSGRVHSLVLNDGKVVDFQTDYCHLINVFICDNCGSKYERKDRLQV